MARTLYLVCYDICHPRRLARVAKLVRGFRVAGQKSFHECWLTPAELADLRAQLLALIEAGEDRVHVFQLDPRLAVQCHGVAETFQPGPFLII
jgi:CRISPR-associated protein Cas2